MWYLPLFFRSSIVEELWFYESVSIALSVFFHAQFENAPEVKRLDKPLCVPLSVASPHGGFIGAFPFWYSFPAMSVNHAEESHSSCLSLLQQKWLWLVLVISLQTFSRSDDFVKCAIFRIQELWCWKIWDPIIIHNCINTCMKKEKHPPLRLV